MAAVYFPGPFLSIKMMRLFITILSSLKGPNRSRVSAWNCRVALDEGGGYRHALQSGGANGLLESP